MGPGFLHAPHAPPMRHGPRQILQNTGIAQCDGSAGVMRRFAHKSLPMSRLRSEELFVHFLIPPVLTYSRMSVRLICVDRPSRGGPKERERLSPAEGEKMGLERCAFSLPPTCHRTFAMSTRRACSALPAFSFCCVQGARGLSMCCGRPDSWKETPFLSGGKQQ